MTSVGEKRRRKKLTINIRQMQAAGRPKLEGERYPSGDLKRSETEAQVKSVAIAAVKRMHDIDTDGKDGLAGYTLGRMLLDKSITKTHLESGNWFAEQIARYYHAIGSQQPSARAQDLFSIRGHTGEATQSQQERATKATNRYMEIERVLLACDNGHQVKTTLYNVCVMDMESLRNMHSTQVSMLHRGLDAISRYRGVDS